MADRLNVLELGDGGLGDAFEGFAGRVGKEVKVQFGHIETLSGGLSAGISGVVNPVGTLWISSGTKSGTKAPPDSIPVARSLIHTSFRTPIFIHRGWIMGIRRCFT
jgi:hypothetical protein